jgi:hypothetical protein
MTLLHFHVDTHDVGYMPDPDNIATFVAIDDAIDDTIVRAEEWLDYVTQGDLETPTRGQPHATEPHTYADEIESVDGQINEIQENLRTNEEYTVEVVKTGLLIILEDGVAVIELTPCSEDTCDEYRDEWIT